MARKVGNIVFKVGTYTDRNGETKNRYLRAGVLLEKDGEFFGSIEATPVGGEGKFSVYADRDNGDRQSPAPQSEPAPQAAPATTAAPDDDLPF